MSEDGTRAVTKGHGDKGVLWDLTNGVKLADLGGPGDAKGIYFNPKNGILITVSNAFHCALWDVRSGAKISDFLQFSTCTGVSIYDEPALILMRSVARQCAIFAKDGRLEFAMPDPADFCAMTKSGDYAYAQDGVRATIYRLARRLPTGVLKLEYPIKELVFSRDGRRLVARDSLDNLTLVDTELAAPIANLGVVVQANWNFLEAGQYVLVKNADNSGTLWDARSGHSLQDFPAGAVDSYSSSKDGKWLVTISEQGQAELRDLAGSRKARKLPEPGYATGAEFSPDSTRLIISSRDKLGYIWDLKRNVMTGAFGVVGASLEEGSKFSENSMFYLTSTVESAAALWDVRRATRVGQLGGPGTVYSQSVSSDGSIVATISNYGQVAVWDTTVSAGAERGSALRRHVCSVNHDAVGRFGMEIRDGKVLDLSGIAFHIRGRPWNPCDWRGPLSMQG